MTTLKYGQIQPENVKLSYKENENVDFVLNFENEKLILNNIRLEGDFFLSKVGGDTPQSINGTDRIGLDHRVGAHSFISGITTTFQNSNLGVIENINGDYPRLVAMTRAGNLSNNDLLNSNYVCELASPDNLLTEKLCKLRTPREFGSNPATSLQYQTEKAPIANAPFSGAGSSASALLPNFSIVPHMCLNKSVGDNDLLDSRQSGAIKITFTLERNLNVIFGVDAIAGSSYQLRNLRLCYMSNIECPVSPAQPVQLRTSLSLKNSLLSSQANVASKVPAICDSVSISYLEQDREANPQYSNVALSMPPNFKRINYMFNDSFNNFYQYEIDNKVEMVQEGLNSMSVNGSNNNATLNLMSANNSFMTGIKWNSFLDLSNTKFNVNQSTDITNTYPYLMFLYFHSIVAIN